MIKRRCSEWFGGNLEIRIIRIPGFFYIQKNIAIQALTMEMLYMEKKLLKQAATYMFNKKEQILIQPSTNLDSSFKTQKEQVDYIAAMLTNLNDLGYEIPPQDIAQLLTMSPSDLNELVYQPVLAAAKEQKGAHVEHNLLFKGFPDSVKNVDESILSNIRFMSYWTGAIDSLWGQNPHEKGSLTRDFVDAALKAANIEVQGKDKTDAEYMQAVSDSIKEKKETRGLAEDRSKIRTLHIATEKDYFKMVENMLASRAALPDYDKEIVLFTVDNFAKELYMPEKIQFRETQALLDVHNFHQGRYENIDIRTIKDFERLLAALSDGDISLSKKQHYYNPSNADRKALAYILEQAYRNNRQTMIESSVTDRGKQFIKNVLENRFHFDSVKNRNYFQDKHFWEKFSDAVQSFQTTMSRFEEQMSKKEFVLAAKELERYSPTLMVQHAREIVGKACREKEMVENDPHISAIEKQLRKAMLSNSIADLQNVLISAERKTDAVTLLKMMNEAFRSYSDVKVIRNAKANDWIFKENKSVPLNNEAISILGGSALQALREQYKNMPLNEQVPIKKGTRVYIDPNLSDFPIPTDDRAATGKNRLLSPGTKVPMAQGDTLQVSLYKKNEYDQFIDHSFVVLDEYYKPVLQGSWNSMKNVVDDKLISCFSGDSCNCRQGVTETHEIYLDTLKEKVPSAKYIAFSALMWDGNPLESCSELFMEAATFNRTEREMKPLEKESAIDPKDVQMKLDITGKGTTAIPMLWDVDAGKMIVVNVELSRTKRHNDLNSALTVPLHFNLPSSCEALENYQTEVASKCYAANRQTIANIEMLASCMVEGKEAVRIDDPTQADVIISSGRIEYEDKRPTLEGQEKPERKVITGYDKDVILTAMIPDAKAIYKALQQQLEEKRQAQWANRTHREPHNNISQQEQAPTLER